MENDKEISWRAAKTGRPVDYHDYLHTRHLQLWSIDNERQKRLRKFCHSHNDYDAASTEKGEGCFS